MMAGRWIAGIGQLLLAVVGCGFVVVWFCKVMSQVYQQFEDGGPTRSVAWLGEVGLLVFAVSWLWALVTSLSLMRQAGSVETKPPQIT